MTGGRPLLGVVDWGIGGVGVVRELDRAAPGLDLVYWSDTGATPYGLLARPALRARLREIVERMAALGCDEVVLACNAASTVVDDLTGGPVPVEGIIGHGVAAVGARAGTIGIVGGRRMIASRAYARGLAAPGRRVVSRDAQPLSAHIEAGRQSTAEFEADLRRIVRPLVGSTAVVLACTHYPAAADAFAAELAGTTLIDPAVALADAVEARLAGDDHASRGRGTRRYLTTGNPDEMRRAARVAWAVDLHAEAVDR